MVKPDRREALRKLLAGLIQTGTTAVVVLTSARVEAGVGAGGQEETPQPEVDPNQIEQPNLDQRVEQAAAQLEEAGAIPAEGDEDSWVNVGWRNGVGGGWPNGFGNGPIGGFGNGPIGGFGNGPVGGFRNTPIGGFGNGPIGGFRNTPLGGFRNGPVGGFRNTPLGSFRNW